MKFRKKPVVIEAKQFTGTKQNQEEINNFVGKKLDAANYEGSNVDVAYLFIETLEGTHKANIGDWIIKGVRGEFYPCKPDIFEKTYDKAE